MQTKTRQVTTSPNLLGLPQSPLEYIDVLRIRWAWIVVPLILGAIASLVASYYVPKRYVSQTVIMVESERIPRSFIPQMTTEQVRDRLRTVEQEVLARPRIERIVDELDPHPDLVTSAGRAYVVELVRSRTHVEVRGEDAFVIEYIDTEPPRAQQMATRLASLFIEETTGARERQVQGANEFIDRQLEETREQMESLETSLRSLKQRYMGMLPEQLEANLATLQRLQLEQQMIGNKIVSAKDRKNLLDRQLAIQAEMNEPEAQLLPVFPGDTFSTAAAPMGQEIAQLRALETSLLKRYTKEHPDVVAVQARIKRLESESESAPEPDATIEPTVDVSSQEGLILAELRAQIAAANREIQDNEQQEVEIRADIARYQQRVEMIPQVEQDLQTIERDHGMVSKYYSELMSRKLQAETARDVERRWKEEQFRILEPAQLPDTPVFPRKSIFLAVGTLIGLGIGIGLAFLLEFLDHSIKYSRELEAVFPYPLVMTLPYISTKDERSWRRKSIQGMRLKKAPTLEKTEQERENKRESA